MIRKIFLVIACISIHMLSMGISLSFGVLYREMRLDFGTSHLEAAWIASIFNGLVGFVGIPLSLIVNKIGERWPTVCGSIFLALGMRTSMFATKISTVYVTYGLLAGLGAGITHYCGYTVLAPHFTNRWRPVALTVASAGVPMSALIVPPILTVLIEQFDWRKAYLFLACISLLGVPAGLSFLSPTLANDSQLKSVAGQPSKIKISRFLKNVDYMLYLVSAFILILSYPALPTFLPDLMHEFDRSSRDVYICVMTLGSCDLTARLLLGFLVQRKPSCVAFIDSAGCMLLCLSSGLITFSRSLEAFIFMSGLMGLGIGCFSALVFVMAVHILPAEDVKFGYGLVLTLGGVAFLSGMPLAGFVTDVFETERGAFIFSSIMLFIGSLLLFIIGVREVCGKKSSMAYTVSSEENTVDIGDEDLRMPTEKSDVVDQEESSHI